MPAWKDMLIANVLKQLNFNTFAMSISVHEMFHPQSGHIQHRDPAHQKETCSRASHRKERSVFVEDITGFGQSYSLQTLCSDAVSVFLVVLGIKSEHHLISLLLREV